MKYFKMQWMFHRVLAVAVVVAVVVAAAGANSIVQFSDASDCGEIFNQTTMPNGTKTRIGLVPWSASVYRKNDDNTHTIICGGTLIASNLVVSAAHCFSDDGANSSTISPSNEYYKIAVGKYEKGILMDSEYTQIVVVKTVYLEPEYIGYYDLYAGDIAVIVLSVNVSINNVVKPVCVDWSNKYDITKGTIGKIAVWNKSVETVHSDDISDYLSELSLPFIDRITCIKKYRFGFQHKDKFCAGSESGNTGQGVDEGDSGSGLTFEHGGVRFLSGIVSLKQIRQNNSIAVFTNISHYITWIRNIYTHRHILR